MATKPDKPTPSSEAGHEALFSPRPPNLRETSRTRLDGSRGPSSSQVHSFLRDSAIWLPVRVRASSYRALLTRGGHRSVFAAFSDDLAFGEGAHGRRSFVDDLVRAMAPGVSWKRRPTGSRDLKGRHVLSRPSPSKPQLRLGLPSRGSGACIKTRCLKREAVLHRTIYTLVALLDRAPVVAREHIEVVTQEGDMDLFFWEAFPSGNRLRDKLR